MAYGPKKLNFDCFVFSDVWPTVTTSVILVKKIQTYTFLDAGNSQEYIGTLNFIFDACSLSNLTSENDGYYTGTTRVLRSTP